MGFFHPAFHVGVFSSARQLLDPPIPGTPRPADAPPFRRGHSRPTLNADAIFCVLALPLRRSLPGPSRLLDDPLAVLRSSSASLRPRRSTPPLPRVGCPAITAPVPTRARAALREHFKADPLVAGPNLAPWSALDPATSRARVARVEIVSNFDDDPTRGRSSRALLRGKRRGLMHRARARAAF